jgi:hemolysin III
VPADRLPQSATPRVLSMPTTAHPEVRVKPRLRGVFHQYAFFVSLASGTLLVLLAATTKASVAAAIYAASVSALFGVSALYHRSTWTTPARRRMRRLDHAMIFLLIAGTYTPVGLLVLQGTLATVVLAVVWGGALAGIAAVYALRRPDPVPLVFGYHEVFHLLVIAGVAAHFLAISLYALPTG